MKRFMVALSVLIALAAVVGFIYLNEMPRNRAESFSSQKESTSSAVEFTLEPASPAFITGLEQLPASLQGTEVDGMLLADENGNIIINHDIRRVFDYFLSTLGDESLAQIEQRLRAHIQHQLPSNAAHQAEQLLGKYMAFNQALSKLELSEESEPNTLLETGVLGERLLSIQSLRREYLPVEVIDAFYTDDDALDQLALARIDIMQDNTLSEDERTKALSDLEFSLPPHLHRVMSDLNKQQQLTTSTTRLRNNGGTDADLYQLRESFYGSGAAERLAVLDESRQQWQTRMTRWLQERNSLMAISGLDNTDRQQQIDRLRRDHFESAELNRVKILERIHDSAP